MNVTQAKGNISENERDESFWSTTVFIYIVTFEQSSWKYFVKFVFPDIGVKILETTVVYGTKMSHTTPWATRCLQKPHYSAETHPTHSVHIVIDKNE